MSSRSWLRRNLPRSPGHRPASPRPGTRLLLEALEDRTVLSTFSVVNTNDNGPGSLRQAILDANAHPNDPSGPDVIEFHIGDNPSLDTGPGYDPTTGICTIRPESLLPSLDDAVVIDGYTQAGASPNTLLGVGQLGVAPGDLAQYGDNAVLKIELDGSAVSRLYPGYPSQAIGLTLDTSATVQGLALNHWE